MIGLLEEMTSWGFVLSSQTIELPVLSHVTTSTPTDLTCLYPALSRFVQRNTNGIESNLVPQISIHTLFNVGQYLHVPTFEPNWWDAIASKLHSMDVVSNQVILSIGYTILIATGPQILHSLWQVIQGKSKIDKQVRRYINPFY